MGQHQPTDKAVVLVVEDEPLIRFLAVEFIQEAGFDVVEAANADEAIGILEARTDIRIVFTDIDMPGGMDGMKLAAAVRDRWPPIEIIIVSGLKRHRDDELPPRAVFFSKPYDLEAVTATLRYMVAAI
ncbi:response regulator [Neorhizobium sp. JUb45]|uniref:response regulator n=1 Tax=Neorhizobium sp. JUb45 TaxID=2485113 RepID=UPI001049D2BD|nr:response regulator [Neorhizobium sp. JUb45]TCQ99331.1 response regulator receiver domain-containing protein [Neorhizobium sp. JUb45]